MKWVVATIGSAIVTFGALIAVLLLPILVAPGLFENPAGVIAGWVIAVPLALIAGFLSFRATLRQYAKPTDVSKGS